VPASDETVVVVPGSVTPGPPISVVLVGVVIGSVIPPDVVVVVSVVVDNVSFGAVGTQIVVVVVSVIVVVVDSVDSFGAVGTNGVVLATVVDSVDSFGAVGTEGVVPVPGVSVGGVDVVVTPGSRVDGGGRGSTDAESSKILFRDIFYMIG